jgi:hypothetical protein
VVITPFKNNVKVCRVGREYMQSGLAVQKVWRLEELVEFNELGDADVAALGGAVEHAFTLRWDKTYNWAAGSAAERAELLGTLFRLCQAHLRAMPVTSLDFSAVPSPEESAAAAMKRSREDELMTVAEEQELVGHLGPDVVGDFDAVYERLGAKLFALETANVQDLMSARFAVTEILSAEARTAAAQLDEMAGWLRSYEGPLRNMRHYIEHIEETNNRMELMTKNQKELLTRLQDLLSRLRLDSARGPLDTADFSNLAAVPQMVASAAMLKDIINIAVHPELAKMTAVKEQLEGARKVLHEFSRKLVKFLCDLFLRIESKAIKEKKATATTSATEAPPKLTDMAYRILGPYVPLVNWLREVDPSSHNSLLRAYVMAFSKVYKKCLKEFAGDIKDSIAKEPKERREKLAAILFAAGSKKVDADWYRTVKVEAPLPEKLFTADKAFGHAYRTLMKVIRAEYDWCSKFFGLSPEQSESAVVLQNMLKELTGDFRADLIELMNIAHKEDPFYLLAVLIETDMYADDTCPVIQLETTAVQSACKHLFG